MNLNQKKVDFVEYVENCFTDFSSFEELFEEYEEGVLLSLIEDSDEYDLIEQYIENEEYSYFINTFLKSLEAVLKPLSEEEFYELLAEFLEEKLEEVTDEEINDFFSWNN